MPEQNADAIATYTKRLQDDPAFAKQVAETIQAVQKGDKSTGDAIQAAGLTKEDLGLTAAELQSMEGSPVAISITVTTATTATLTSPTTATTVTLTTLTAVQEADPGR